METPRETGKREAVQPGYRKQQRVQIRCCAGNSIPGEPAMELRENSPNLATDEGRKARKNGAGRTGDRRRWPAQRDPGNRVLSAKGKDVR